MKKHFLRALVVLMLVCFGVGALAACGGDEENPAPPAEANPIEGVWSGASAELDFGGGATTETFVATVDLLSGAAHDGYVVIEVSGKTETEETLADETASTLYLAFPIDKDGETYKGDLFFGDDTVEVTIALAENKLTATLPPFGASEDATTLTFDKKEELPATPLALTGIRYAEDDDNVYTVDFTNKTFKVNTETAPTKFANVGNFIVVELTMPGEGSTPSMIVCMVVYKAEDTYYLSIMTEAHELGTTPIEPQPSEETYTVTFDAGEAGDEVTLPDETDTFGEGVTYYLPKTEPQWGTDHNFTGWEADTDGQIYQAGDPYTFTASNVTFTAQWESVGEPTDSIDGVWTNADTGTTLAIKFEGSIGGAVVKSGTEYTYYPLTKEGEAYTGTSAMESTISIAVAGDDLSVTLTGGAQTFTFTSALPTELEIEGTYWGSDAGSETSIEIDFTNSTLKMSAEPVDSVSFIPIGEYIVIEAEYMGLVIYEDGGKYYASGMGVNIELTEGSLPAPSAYRVTFDKNAGSDNVTGMPANVEDQAAGLYLIPADEPSRAGYTFLGWTLNANGEGTVYKNNSANPSVTVEDNITFYAKWEANKYTVTFEVGTHGTTSGQTSYADQTVESGAITVPAVTAKAGYTFTGWKVKDKQTTVEGTYTVNAADAVEGAITIEAQYEPITYTLKLEKGDIPAEPTMPQDGLTVSLESTQFTGAPTLQYYTFLGWTWTIGGIGEEDPATTFTFTEEMAEQLGSTHEITLTANWAIVIGNDGLTNEYPGDYGEKGSGIEFQETIAKGNHYIFTGTQRSSVSVEGNAWEQNYRSIKFFVWSGDKPNGIFRLDDAYAQKEGMENNENWIITGFSPTRFGNGDAEYRKALNGSIVVDVDWTDASIITIKATLAAEGADFVQYYTIEGKAGHPLAETYKFGFGTEASQTKFTKYEITQEALSETPIIIGNARCDLPYTNMNPAWYGKSIKSGEKVVLTGTLKSAGNHTWEVPVAYFMSVKGQNHSILRTDGCAIFGSYDEPEWVTVASKPGISRADTNYDNDNQGNEDTTFMDAIKAGGVTFTLTYDWTEASKIVITAKFEKDGLEGGRETVFTITAQAEHSLAEQYYIGLGGENIYLQIGSVVYSGASVEPSPDTTEYTFKFYQDKGQYEDELGTKTATLADGAHLTADDILDAASKTNYTFAGWYIEEDGDEIEINESFVPSDHEGTQFNVYAKWTLNDTITLEEVAPEGWHIKAYQYPENINVGDVLTLTGDLTMTRADNVANYDGVHIALSKTNFTDHVTFCYNWQINREETKYQETANGFLTCSIPGAWDSVGFPQIINGENVKLTAVVSYPIPTQVQIVYTIKATVEGQEQTFSVTYVYHGINGDPVSVGLAGEQAKLNNGQIVRSKITAPQIEDTMDQQRVTIGSSTTSVYGTEVYKKDIKAGQTLTITGNLQAANTNLAGFGIEMVPYGAANLIADNGVFNFRIDNAATQSNGWNYTTETCERYNYSIAKAMTRVGSPNVEGEDDINGVKHWADFAAAKQDCDVTVTIAWTEADKIVITMSFSNSQTDGYTGYSAKQTYTVTPISGHLADVYSLTISPDAGYIANAQAQVTYAEIGG